MRENPQERPQRAPRSCHLAALQKIEKDRGAFLSVIEGLIIQTYCNFGAFHFKLSFLDWLNKERNKKGEKKRGERNKNEKNVI